MSLTTSIMLSDPAFVNALAFAMAAELAIPLRGKPDLAVLMNEAYLASLNQAAALSLSEGFDRIPDCGFLSSRNG